MLVLLYGSQSLIQHECNGTDDRAPRQIFLGTIETRFDCYNKRIKGANCTIANAGEAGGRKPDIR